MDANRLAVIVYNGLSATPRPDPSRDLKRATVESLSTFFPGGLYGTASIFIPRDVTAPFLWRGGDRVVIRNGLTIVYEGEIDSIGYSIQENNQGIRIKCVGLQGRLLQRRTIDKRWADDRIGDDVWTHIPEFPPNETTDIKRGNNIDEVTAIRLTPKEMPFKTNELALLKYTMPLGDTVKRVTANYDFNEDGDRILQFAKWNNDPAGANTFTDMTNAIDGSANHYDLTLTSDDYIYVGHQTNVAWAAVKVDMGTTVNVVTATLSCQYYKAATDTAPAGWSTLAITDNTASGGATLAIDGSIIFTPPTDWQKTTIDGDNAFWLRFQSSANLTASIDIRELYLVQAQNWRLSIYDEVGAAHLITATATGSGSGNSTLGTPRNSIQIRLISQAEQTPRGDGSYFGEFSSIVVYSETGSINLTEIAKDIIPLVDELNTYTGLVASNTLSLVPFYTEGAESVASILDRAVAFGDSSFNNWYYQLVDSERAETPNGEPVLQVGQWPTLTDYEYIVSVDEQNLVNSIEFSQDIGSIVNAVTVVYRSTATGGDIVLTPDYDATLQDDDSIAAYGERHLERPLTIQASTVTMALNMGKAFLATRKDPRFFVSSPISIVGTIRGKNGNPVPVSEIKAGQRVRIVSFLDDLAGTSGAGLTQIIADTDYNDDEQVCRLNLQGVPDNLAIILAGVAK